MPNQKSWQDPDAKRRHRHFQVRLDERLSEQLQHYADRNHDGVINPALFSIVSQFFNRTNA